MISCRDADSMLSRRLDGELPSDLERDLSEHLERCPACRSLEGAESRRAEALRSALAVEGEVLQSIREMILRKTLLQKSIQERAVPSRRPLLSRRPFPSRRFGRQALALAAAVSIGVLVWLAFSGGAPDGPTGGAPGVITVEDPTGILFVQQRSSDSPSLPVDGDPMLRWQIERLKAILTDPSEDVDPSRTAIRIEVERDRNLIVPVNNSWY